MQVDGEDRATLIKPGYLVKPFWSKHAAKGNEKLIVQPEWISMEVAM